MTTTKPFLTVGAIARRLGRPVHWVEYVIRSWGFGWLGGPATPADFARLWADELAFHSFPETTS